MSAIRRLLACRMAAIWLCAATLLLKLLVPTGYMIGAAAGGIAIIPCPGVVAAMPTAMPGMHGHGPDHGKAEMPCAFAALSAQMLGGADAILLAVAVAYVLAMGLAPAVLRAPFAPHHLRPPPRAPPLRPSTC